MVYWFKNQTLYCHRVNKATENTFLNAPGATMDLAGTIQPAAGCKGFDKAVAKAKNFKEMVFVK